MNEIFPVEKLNLIFGFDDKGRAVATPLVAGPYKQIMIVGRPARYAIVISKHPVSGEETTTEFNLNRYYAVEITELRAKPVEAGGSEAPLPEVPVV